MKTMRPPRLAPLLALLLATCLPHAAQACAVCFGNEDTPVTQAANGAILFMLAILVPVLGSFLGFIVYLVRRQAQPLPEHAALALEIERESGGDPEHYQI